MKTKKVFRGTGFSTYFLPGILMLGLCGEKRACAQEALLQMVDPPAAPAGASNSCSILCFLLIGVLLGTGGQIARVVVGLKKELDIANAGGTAKKWSEWFDVQEFLVSLLIGGAAGTFAALEMMGAAIDKRFLIACIGAGYAGADFIQGFITKNVPTTATTPLPPTSPAASPPPKITNPGN